MTTAFGAGAGRFTRWLAALLAFGVLLSGCTHDDDEGETPTAAPRTATTTGSLATAIPTAPAPASTNAAATLTDANGQQISDGVCEAFIPDGWVDDGTGHGTTTSGARFTLFGGVVSNDTGWQSAADAVATPGAGRKIAATQRDADSIRVTYADGKGFEYRGRFADRGRYCDISVYRAAGAIPAAEQGFWDSVIASLKPLT